MVKRLTRSLSNQVQLAVAMVTSVAVTTEPRLRKRQKQPVSCSGALYPKQIKCGSF